MESSQILNRMASYDFQAPIDVLCLEEENSNGQIDLTSSPESTTEDIETDIVAKPNTANKTKKKETPERRKKGIQVNKDIKKTSNGKKRKSIENSECNIIIEEDIPKPTKSCRYDNNYEHVCDGLKTISKYLTLILESYTHYTRTLNDKKCTSDDVSLSRQSHVTMKYHFFNAAYEYVNSYIIPNENNQSYIHSFLNYTSFMACQRINADCNKAVMEIYFEMLKWVKQRNYKDYTDGYSTPLLRKQLRDPPITSTATSSQSVKVLQQQFSSNTDQSKLCIFSSGPLGSQISINVDKSLMTNENQSLHNINQIPQNSVVLQQNQNIKQNLSQISAQITKQSYGNIQMNSELLAKHNNGLQKVDDKTSNNKACYNSYYNYYHTTNNYQNSNYYSQNNIISGPNTLQAPIEPVNKDRSLLGFRRDKNYPASQNIYGPPPQYHPPPPYHPPPYHSPAINPNEMRPLTQAPTIHPSLSSGPDLTRSSVSTDSGFISPGGSKSSSNPIEDIMNELLELEKVIEPPQSTSATQFCHVCHRQATLMCSACFKTNYCNTTCQRMDWNAHRLICQTGTRNH